jgi:serine protease Do
VTNNHALDGGKKIIVALQDGRKFTARLLGRDDKTDLALLKIDADALLPFVSWGDSGKVQPGDWVLAVGNPFGLGGTVSAGIVSARGRDIKEGPYDDFLQIDAPINRGNSGGPSFGLDGRVIGINTAIYTPNGGSVGVAFAIPSDLAQSVIAQLQAHGKVSRGWLGVEVQAVTPSIARALGLPGDHGALVNQVEKDSPAAKAGIREGDVIEAFNGHAVDRTRELPITVANTPVGSDAKVKLRRQGKEMTLSVRIAEQSTDLEAAIASGESEAGSAPGAFGVGLGPLTPALRERLELPPQLQGVVVRSISKSSPLNDMELEPNDVILSINQHPVAAPDEAERLLKLAEAAPHKHVLLLINRNGENEYLAWSEQNQG